MGRNNHISTSILATVAVILMLALASMFCVASTAYANTPDTLFQLQKRVSNTSVAWTFNDVTSGQQGNFTFELTQGETSDVTEAIKTALDNSSLQVKQGVLPITTDATTASDGSVKWDGATLENNTAYVYRVSETHSDRKDIIWDKTPFHKLVIAKNDLPIPSDENAFNALSWDELSALSAQCAATDGSEYQSLLGFTKDVQVAGVGAVKAKLIGINHDTYADGSGTAGFTFQLTDGLSYTSPVNFQMNGSDTNSGGWASSLMRSTNLPKLKTALPADLQGVIKKVTKKTSTQNSGTAVSETQDDLFLLSLIESIGTSKTNYSDNPIASSNYLYNEGTQYEYYVKHPTQNDHIIKDNTGSASNWWLRSMNLNNTSSFYDMITDGDWYYSYASSIYHLPAAGFCL